MDFSVSCELNAAMENYLTNLCEDRNTADLKDLNTITKLTYDTLFLSRYPQSYSHTNKANFLKEGSKYNTNIFVNTNKVKTRRSNNACSSTLLLSWRLPNKWIIRCNKMDHIIDPIPKRKQYISGQNIGFCVCISSRKKMQKICRKLS